MLKETVIKFVTDIELSGLICPNAGRCLDLCQQFQPIKAASRRFTNRTSHKLASLEIEISMEQRLCYKAPMYNSGKSAQPHKNKFIVTTISHNYKNFIRSALKIVVLPRMITPFSIEAPLRIKL